MSKPQPPEQRKITYQDKEGKWFEIPLDVKLPEAMVPGVIDGYLRSAKKRLAVADILSKQAQAHPTAAEQGGGYGQATIAPGIGEQITGGLSNAAQKVGQGIADVGAGFGKELGRRGMQAASILGTPGQGLVLPGTGLTTTIPPPQALNQAAAPTGIAQTVGQQVERAGEFVSGGEGASAVTQGMNLPLRMAAQGAAAAGVGATQGQTPGEAALTGVTAAAVPAITEKAWPAVKDWVTKKVTSRMLNNLMEIKPQWLEHGADPGGQVIKEGIMAGSKESMAAKVGDKLKDAGMELSAKLATGAKTPIDAENIVINALNNGSKRIGLGSDPAFQQKLTNILDDIIKQAPASLNKLTPVETQALKTAIGDSVKWTGAPFEGDVNKVLLDMYRGLNTATEQAVPGTKELLTRYGNLRVAKNGLKATMLADKTRGFVSGSTIKNIVKPLSGAGAKTGLGQAFKPGASPVVSKAARLVQSAFGTAMTDIEKP